ncbi:hypothetical protein BDZ94DRAFT_1180606 [Collybia nuda]|uniref:Uncharacterized protein n=1 Tax=Collybia nuda TaxID=64659 RepID=A0A9P5YHN2_9AGAR|nr:hypothetical protein BDZ94DRAFT_1180606 [Collybia nuda]
MPRNSGSKTANAITALEILRDVAKLGDSIPYLEGIAGVLSTIIKMKQELDQCDEEWTKAMEGIEQIKRLVLKFVGPSYQRQLPPFVVDAFADLKVCVDEVLEAFRKYKEMKRWKRAFKRNMLKDDAIVFSDKIWKAVKLFETDLVVENAVLIHEIHAVITGGAAISSTGFAALQCPTPSDYFMGRKTILEVIESSFSSPGRCVLALVAKGGAGKTQVALKHASDATQKYSHLFFIDASSSDTLTRAFKTMAEAAQVGASAVAASLWLSGLPDDWLLILDNADDPNLDLSPYLPRCSHAKIIITSRNESIFKHASPNCAIKFPDLAEVEAVDLLLLRTGIEDWTPQRPAALELVTALGFHALAVSAAGAYISQLCTIEEYLEDFRAAGRRRELLEREDGQSMDSYTFTVYSTFRLSFAKLSDRARKFMNVCSFLHNASIPVQLFHRAAIEVTTDLSLLLPGEQEPVPGAVDAFRSFLCLLGDGRERWSSLRFREIISELQRFSLISFDIKLQACSIHPLLHAYTRDSIEGGDVTRLISLHLLSAATPDDDGDPNAAHIRILFITHVDSAWDDDTGKYTDFVCVRLGDIFRTNRDSRRGRMSELRAVSLRTDLLGENHPDTLVMMAHLGRTYQYMGQLHDADDMQTKVLAQQKEILGESNRDTLRTMYNLAWTRMQLGKLEEARDLGEKALELRRELLGDSHIETRRSMGNLAWTYSLLGLSKKAEKLQLEALNSWKAEHGELHPETWHAMADLSVTLSGMGRLEEAEVLGAKALEFRMKGLGEFHPGTLYSMVNMVLVYTALGRIVDAEAMGTRVLELQKSVLGETHPATLLSMTSLAESRWELGNRSSALEIMTAAVEGREKALGPDHADTHEIRNQLRDMKSMVLEDDST